MAQRTYEGIGVYWAADVADPSSPTAAEITAATDISCDVVKDGLAPNISTNNVDASVLCDRFDRTIPGSFGADFMITGKRDDETEVLWDLAVYGTEGFLIIDNFGEAGVLPVAGAKVQVWPAIMNQKSPASSAANTMQRFSLPLNITASPELDATVAA